MRLLLQRQRRGNHQEKMQVGKTAIASLQSIISSLAFRKCVIQNFKNNILQKQAILHCLFDSEIPFYRYKLSLNINYASYFIVYRISFVKNGSLLLVNSNSMRLNIMHKVLKYYNQQNESFQLRINNQNGLLELANKINYSKLLFFSSSQLTKEVELKVKEILAYAHKYLRKLVFQMNEPSRIFEQEKQITVQHVEKIKRHIFYSSHDLGLSEKASQYRYPGEDTLMKREKIIKNLLDDQGKSVSLFQEGNLFGLIDSKWRTSSKEWRREFQNSQYFEKFLQIPSFKTNNPQENPYIFNQIQIKDAQKVISRQVIITPMTKIKLISVSMINLMNNKSKNNKAEPPKQFINKHIVVKQPKGENLKQKSKLLHQKNIVRLFSSASSSYLLKYYDCKQDKFAYKNALLMDFHPSNISFFQHLTIRRDSLSLELKLSILTHLSNALRFLSYYKIVHMDLNLNNILIHDGFFPKLIDFGQAYHLQTIEKSPKGSYSPGFTIPYCPPQVFSTKQFKPSQDIFSFGVIIFRVLLNMLPFFPSDNLISSYRNKQYHDKIFLCPQRITDVCKEQTGYLLMLLVDKCMKSESQNRPLPIWSTIILRGIAQLFQL